MAKKSRNISGKKANTGAKGSNKSGRTSNPFEIRKNKKQKHVVLNRRTKGAERNVALARSKAQDKRHKTLLADYIQSTKSNSVVDKRFGEDKDGLTMEDKYFMRFQKTRKKKSIYNLSEQGESENLFGQSLGKSSDNQGQFDESDSEEEEKIDANELMRRLQEQGISSLKRKYGDDLTIEELQQKRSKKEIMEEVMKKSKLFKMERQRQQEEDEEERERLDEQILSIMDGGLLTMRPTKKQIKEEEKNAILERLMAKRAGKPIPEEKKVTDDKPVSQNDLDYERSMRELIFDKRLAASSRTKTPEEIAKEEREELEEQQARLVKRMRGESISDSEDDQPKKKSRKPKGGDDLDDNWAVDEFGNDIRVDSEEEEEESESSDEEESSDDEESEKPAKLSESKKQKARNEALDRRQEMLKAQKELPFLLDAPDNHIEFLEIFQKYENATVENVIDRVIKSNSVHLAAENRSKMTAFAGILIDHLVFVVDKIVFENLGEEARKEPDIIVHGLYKLAKQIPIETGREFMSRLSGMQRTLNISLNRAAEQTNAGGDYGCDLARKGQMSKLLKKRKAGGHKGHKGRKLLEEEMANEEYESTIYDQESENMMCSDGRCWPSPGEIAFFRATASIFPPTDYRHPVISPAQLLLGQYLSQCPIRGPRDLVAAVITCQLALEFTKDANRVCPELVVALEAIFGQVMASPKAKVSDVLDIVTCSAIAVRKHKALSQFDWFRRGLHSMDENKSFKEQENEHVLELSFLKYGEDTGVPSVKLCETILHSLVGVTRNTVESLKENEGLDLLFSGVVASLDASTLEKLKVQTTAFKSVYNLRNEITNSCNHVVEHRRPLQLQNFKPEPIRAIAPKFNENYQWSKFANDPNRERAEAKKLKKQVKRERKGVARELRKDGAYLADVRSKEKEEKQNELRDRRRKNMAFLMSQAAGFNAAVKYGGEVRGGGTGGVDMKGKRRR